MYWTIRSIAVGLTVTAIQAAHVFAQEIAVQTIMDRHTLLENGDHPNAISTVTTRDGRVLIFNGSASAINMLHEWDGVTLHQLLATGDPIPGTPYALRTLGRIAVSASRVIAEVSPPFGPYSALCELPVNGPMRVLTSTNDDLPGDATTPLNYSALGSDIDGNFFFISYYRTGEITTAPGLYRCDGTTMQLCADGTTSIPGRPNEHFWAMIDMSSFEQNAALVATTLVNGSTVTGLYAYWNGVLCDIVTPGFGLPEHEFSEVLAADTDDGVIRFVARPRFGDNVFIWEWSGDDVLGIQPLMDVGCQIPGSATSNWSVHQLSSDGADILFEGVGLVYSGDGQARSYALYLYRGGTVTRLIGGGDAVGGLPFATIGTLHQDSISNRHIAVKCTLMDPGGQFGQSDVALLIDYSQLHPCPDVTCDGLVDLSDLAILLRNFGLSSHRSLFGDLDGDGSVTLTDLARMLSQFGEECP